MSHRLLMSEESLLELLRKGDSDAFTKIYEQYWFPLYQTAVSRLKNREAAEELVQDLFIQIWEKRENLQIAKLEHYLFKAIKYAVIDYIRSETSHNRSLEYYTTYLTMTAFDAEESGHSESAYQRLKKGIEQLPEKTRHILILNRLEGWTIQRIAQHYDLSDKAIEYHLAKSLKLLRLSLKSVMYCCLLPFIWSFVY